MFLFICIYLFFQTWTDIDTYDRSAFISSWTAPPDIIIIIIIIVIQKSSIVALRLVCEEVKLF